MRRLNRFDIIIFSVVVLSVNSLMAEEAVTPDGVHVPKAQTGRPVAKESLKPDMYARIEVPVKNISNIVSEMEISYAEKRNEIKAKLEVDCRKVQTRAFITYQPSVKIQIEFICHPRPNKEKTAALKLQVCNTLLAQAIEPSEKSADLAAKLEKFTALWTQLGCDAAESIDVPVTEYEVTYKTS